MVDITKTGRITAVEKKSLQVELQTCSACGDCSIKSSCGLREYRTNVIKIATDQASSYHVGDNVEVSLSSKNGIIAVIIAFVIPLILLIGTVISGYLYGLNDIQNCICAIIILIPYYFALFLSRRIWERKFCCTLKNYQSKD